MRSSTFVTPSCCPFEREQPDVVSHHAAQISGRSINALRCRGQCPWDAQRAGARAKPTPAGQGCPRHCDLQRRCSWPARGPLVDEDHPPASSLWRKRATEIYLIVYRQTHGLKTTVLRYGNVYGPRQDPAGVGGVPSPASSSQMLAGGEAPTVNAARNSRFRLCG